MTINKEKIYELIKNSGYEGQLVDDLKDFITTYDGTNGEQLYILVYDYVMLLTRIKELGLKAGAFDKVRAEDDLFKKKVESIKQDYKGIEEGKGLPDPSQEISD